LVAGANDEAPNVKGRLVVDIEFDKSSDSSVVEMHPDTMEELEVPLSTLFLSESPAIDI
jgi:hypothetical protein